MSTNSNRQYFFYYLRRQIEKSPSKIGHPFGCVCISPNEDGTVNRGVSICSVKDFFNKKKARGMAFSRCNSSVYSDFNRPLSPKMFHGNKNTFTHTITYGLPTDFEKRILTKPED